jgi:hypothetical protein
MALRVAQQHRLGLVLENAVVAETRMACGTGLDRQIRQIDRQVHDDLRLGRL